jgi:hypothetical protein
MLAEINAALLAIKVPTLTVDPFSTTGMAGAPRCWDRGILTSLGRGRVFIGLLADNLYSKG